VYAENLSPEELANILRYLGAQDTGTPDKQSCDSVIVGTLTSDHRRDLARLLGTSTDNLAAPPKAPPREELPLPPITDTIIEVPPGSQNPPTTAPVKIPSTPERLALVLAYDATSPDGPGPEVRDFLRRRQEQRPGTLQVVFVVREVRA
jgi:hypothetical protein